MRKTVYPKKLYFLGAFALLWAVLAYLSRCEAHLPFRAVFKVIGLGNASLIEHFAAGFAAPAAFVAIILLGMPFTSKTRFVKTNFRVLAYVKFRRWLMTRSRPTYITHWTTVFAFLYVMVSLQWEVNQVGKHGFFQLNQFGMDLVGAFAFCVTMWATLEKNRQRAKAQRSFSLV